MSKFMHIVQVYLVENGEPNLSKVEMEREFDDKIRAENWIKSFNQFASTGFDEIAVYVGCVNDETGELI